MTRDFSQMFDVIYDRFIVIASEKKIPSSVLEFGRFLGHGHDGKLRAWKKGQWPTAEDCWTLEKLLGLNLRWLVTGEGDPFDEAPPEQTAPPAPTPAPAPAPEPSPPVVSPPPQNAPTPLIGFASCSTFGWHGTMSIPVPVEPPAWHEGMVAVMASGESMLPAGIGHGHICYCDPTKAPGMDEAVYVETTDGLGTIKLFCGWSVRGGERYLNLRGWLDKDPKTDKQNPVTIDVIEYDVRKIAPVVYVRRRL